MIPTRSKHAMVAGVAVVALLLAGCGRDTRVNSDPGPGKPSAADGGDAAVKLPPDAAPSTSGAAATLGTDSTGRPSDASGGTTGAGAGSNTGGTVPEREIAGPESRPRG